MAEEQVRYAQLYARGVACELRVNDIPVTDGAADEITTAGMPVRHLIVPGENTLGLTCRNDGGQSVGGYSSLALVTARVADFWEGDTLNLENGSEHARLTPSFNDETPSPFGAKAPFLSRDGGDWFWAKAPVLNLQTVRPELDRFVAFIFERFAARDMGALVPFYEPAIRDRVAAYPVLSIDGQINMTRGKLATTNPETWRVLPFDPSQVVYRPCAGGRMVEALGADGLPLIRSTPLPAEDPEQSEDPVYIRNLIGLHEGQLKFLV